MQNLQQTEDLLQTEKSIGNRYDHEYYSSTQYECQQDGSTEQTDIDEFQKKQIVKSVISKGECSSQISLIMKQLSSEQQTSFIDEQFYETYCAQFNCDNGSHIMKQLRDSEDLDHVPFSKARNEISSQKLDTIDQIPIDKYEQNVDDQHDQQIDMSFAAKMLGLNDLSACQSSHVISLPCITQNHAQSLHDEPCIFDQTLQFHGENAINVQDFQSVGNQPCKYMSQEEIECDDNLILAIIQRSIEKKSSAKKFRRDVIIKTIMRIMRTYYGAKLDELTAYKKKKRKNQVRPHFTSLTDSFASEFFTAYKISSSPSLNSISNYLSALIYPKRLSLLKKSDQNNDQRASKKSTRSPDGKPNIKIRKRENIVEEIARQTHDLLYSYNKNKLQDFLSIHENLILTKFFLAKATHALASSGYVPEVKPLETKECKKRKRRRNRKEIQNQQESIEDITIQDLDSTENDQTSDILKVYSEQVQDLHVLCLKQIENVERGSMVNRLLR